ncbi:MAG: hypothetical protein LBQ88_09780 [Treponema sp.]|jgi:hypothetical protein|nr:hypothetical protein [Treponema sp.]
MTNEKVNPESPDEVIGALRITGLNDFQISFVMAQVDDYVRMVRVSAHTEGHKAGYLEATSGLFGNKEVQEKTL